MYKWRLWTIPAQQVVSTLVGIHTSWPCPTLYHW